MMAATTAWDSSNACGATIVGEAEEAGEDDTTAHTFTMYVGQLCCADQKSQCDGDWTSICNEEAAWTPTKALSAFGSGCEMDIYNTDFCNGDYTTCEGMAFALDMGNTDFFPLTCSDVSDLSLIKCASPCMKTFLTKTGARLLIPCLSNHQIITGYHA